MNDYPPTIETSAMDTAHNIVYWLEGHFMIGQSKRRELATRIANAISQAYYLVTGRLHVNANENYWALECAAELDRRWSSLKTDKEVAEIILSYAPARRALSAPPPDAPASGWMLPNSDENMRAGDECLNFETGKWEPLEEELQG
ncbi:hypothetical protein, partial [Mesomycoplasma ovipneumoniae]|uniref:hypothetical protein n=1 Tax=Mesomycoplasma ovipneumoniae TaxID=29562 RepID=UPI0030804434